jgi:hypothetical protein
LRRLIVLREKIVESESDKAMQAPSQPAEGRKRWTDPALVKLEAGDAETGPLYSPDNTFGS